MDSSAEDKEMPTPYAVRCDCGEELKATGRNMDSDGDITVFVAACENCMAEAKADGRQEAQDEMED